MLVDIPKEKTFISTRKNGAKYVMYRVKAYRDSKGRATSQDVMIGKVDDSTGQLIPNKNYEKLFNFPLAPLPKSIENIGLTRFLEELSLRLHLSQVLQSVFPESYQDILTLAFYMIDQGNILSHFEMWTHNVYTQTLKASSSQQISRLLSSITDRDIQQFFKEWANLLDHSSALIYDVTSISSYSKHLKGVEWGYNRDKEFLPQLNLGMIYSQNSRLPIAYHMYQGSITDKTMLTTMFTCYQRILPRGVTFILDQGFVTKDNLSYMQEEKIQFVTYFPKKLKAAKQFLNQMIGQVRKAEQLIPRYNLYGKKAMMNYEGIELMGHTYYDTERDALEEKRMLTDLHRAEEQLSQAQQGVKITRLQKAFFDIEKEGNETVNYRINHQKIDEITQYFGYFTLITNDKNLSSEEVLRMYRQKDFIEKGFDDFKNELDFSRLRTHSNETTKGKVFVGFIALIIRSYLLSVLREKTDNDEFMSLPEILKQLSSIKVVELADGKRYVFPLTHRQKQIYALFNFDSELLKTV